MQISHSKQKIHFKYLLTVTVALAHKVMEGIIYSPMKNADETGN